MPNWFSSTSSKLHESITTVLDKTAAIYTSPLFHNIEVSQGFNTTHLRTVFLLDAIFKLYTHAQKQSHGINIWICATCSNAVTFQAAPRYLKGDMKQ